MPGKTVETEAQRPGEQCRRCMALVTHNFSKLPPPFPAAHGLTVQGSGILGGFHSSCISLGSTWLQSPARLQPSYWPLGTKRAISPSCPISAGTVLLPGQIQSRLQTSRRCPPLSHASLPGAVPVTSPMSCWGRKGFAESPKPCLVSPACATGPRQAKQGWTRCQRSRGCLGKSEEVSSSWKRTGVGEAGGYITIWYYCPSSLRISPTYRLGINAVPGLWSRRTPLARHPPSPLSRLLSGIPSSQQ